MDEATSRLESHGIIAHGYVAFGRTIDALPRHANMLRSDMVMIGHRACERVFRWWGAPLAREPRRTVKGLYDSNGDVPIVVAVCRRRTRMGRCCEADDPRRCAVQRRGASARRHSIICLVIYPSNGVSKWIPKH